jgi:hypothetical protein
LTHVFCRSASLNTRAIFNRSLTLLTQIDNPEPFPYVAGPRTAIPGSSGVGTVQICASCFRHASVAPRCPEAASHQHGPDFDFSIQKADRRREKYRAPSRFVRPGRVVGKAQDSAAVKSNEACGPMDEGEAHRFHARQPGRNGYVRGSAACGRRGWCGVESRTIKLWARIDNCCHALLAA